jgi:hypothetical protein
VHPGYESVGIRVGPWMYNPSLTVGGFYDNNVFASNLNVHSDLAAVIHPSLVASSLWERHALNIQADAESRSYRENPGLDQINAGLRARGRIDISHEAVLLGNFRVAALHEGVGSLSSPAGAVEPTPYNYGSANITYLQRVNRLAASLGVRTDFYNYGSTRAQDGSIINQDSRDGHIYVLHGRLDYAISPDFGVFSAFEVNRRDLRGTPTQSLSSDGYRALAGINIQLTHLITGDLGVGYASQQFDDVTIGTIQGPTYRALLTWSPTRSLDVHFKAEQIVTEVADTYRLRAAAQHRAVSIGNVRK